MIRFYRLNLENYPEPVNRDKYRKKFLTTRFLGPQTASLIGSVVFAGLTSVSDRQTKEHL